MVAREYFLDLVVTGSSKLACQSAQLCCQTETDKPFSHSRQALKKYVLANNKLDNVPEAQFTSLFNRALSKGSESGIFARPKGTSGPVKLAKPADAAAAKPTAKAAPKEKKITATKEKKAPAAKKATATKATAKKTAAPKKTAAKAKAPATKANTGKARKTKAPAAVSRINQCILEGLTDIAPGSCG